MGNKLMNETITYPLPILKRDGDIIEGYICLYDKADNHGDVIRSGDFLPLIGIEYNDLPVLLNCNLMQPAGKVLSMVSDEQGLYAKIKLEPEICNSINSAGLSFGYQTIGNKRKLMNISVDI